MTNAEKVADLRISIEELINTHIELVEHDMNVENFTHIELVGILDAIKFGILMQRKKILDNNDNSIDGEFDVNNFNNN